jgi:hypothetical protein
MIAKRVRRSKASSDFGRLGRYILEAASETAEILWTRTADTVPGLAGTGGKVAWARISNCVSEEPGCAIAEIELTQEMNTRTRADRSYHLVVSFPTGERPTREQLEAIEDEICAGLGYAEHQRLSAVHTNTGNLHIHIAISRVHPVTFRCIEPYYDHRELARLCRRLEAKHGLRPDNHIDGPALPRQPDATETHTGQVSLLSWIEQTAGPDLTACSAVGTGWQDLHAVLERYGLEIRPHGPGLVIGRTGASQTVKASSVNRALSFQALTGRWGPFVPPVARRAAPPEQQYQPVPAHLHPGTAALYQHYQQQHEAAIQARRAAREQLRRDHADYATDLAAWYARRRQDIRSSAGLSRPERRTACRELAQQRRADFAARRTLEAGQRKALAAAYPLPTWQDFLQDAAGRGDALALAVLRSRQQGEERCWAANLLRAGNAGEACPVVFGQLRPQARRNGDMVYRTGDGGVVVDEATRIRVEQLTAGASFLALALAGDRFGDRALIVEGEAAFKAQVTQLAALKGLNLRFADPAMEQERQRLAATCRAPAPSDAEGVMVERDSRRALISAIDYQQIWAEDDAGSAVYQGRLDDGSGAVLMKHGTEVLMKPVGAMQATRASQWRIGQAVELDARGRFAGRTRTRR